MRLIKQENGGVLLARINAWEMLTLNQLPKLANFTGHEEAEKRLLPAPAVEADLTPEMAMDWVEYVTPQIREGFRESVEIVTADLAKLEPEPRSEAGNPEIPAGKTPPSTWRLHLPEGHADHWYRTMNQARLVMSVKYGIDSENAPDLPALLESGKLELWFHYEFFVSLQAWLVEYVMDSP